MESLLIAAVTGLISSAGTIAAIKIDIGWIKQTQEEFKERLSQIESRVSELEKR